MNHTLAATVVVLAFALLAVPTADGEPSRAAGPYPAPDGGVWFVLPPHDDGSVEAVHLAADGAFVAAVTLRDPRLSLLPRPFAALDGGGFRVTGRPRGDGEGDRGLRLAAFDVEGKALGRMAVDGDLFALDGDGNGYAAEKREERVDVIRLDPVATLREPLFELSLPGLTGYLPGSSHPLLGDPSYRSFALARADDGAFFLLTDPSLPNHRGEHTWVLRRYAADGEETAGWRLPDAQERYRLAEGDEGTVLLLADGAAWEVGAGGVVARHDVSDVGEGGRGDGAASTTFRLGAAPQGTTWSDLERRFADDSSPLDLALFGSGPAADTAYAELREMGAPAVDLLVAWIAAAPRGSGSGPPPYRSLLGDLFADRPDAVGERLTARLHRVPKAHRRHLVEIAVEAWPQPSPAFLARLADALTGDDEALSDAAGLAFESAGDPTNDAGDAVARFPAPPVVQRFYLDVLVAGSFDDDLGHLDGEWFFFAQLPLAGPLLDAVLTDREHPAREAVLEWLEWVPDWLAIHPPAELVPLAPAFEQWSARWSAADEPRQARAARLVAAAFGEPEAVAALPALLAADPALAEAVACVVDRLGKHHPGALGDAVAGELTALALGGRIEDVPAFELLAALGGHAGDDWWSALAHHFEEAPPPASGRWVATALLAQRERSEPAEAPGDEAPAADDDLADGLPLLVLEEPPDE